MILISNVLFSFELIELSNFLSKEKTENIDFSLLLLESQIELLNKMITEEHDFFMTDFFIEKDENEHKSIEMLIFSMLQSIFANLKESIYLLAIKCSITGLP